MILYYNHVFIGKVSRRPLIDFASCVILQTIDPFIVSEQLFSQTDVILTVSLKGNNGRISANRQDINLIHLYGFTSLHTLPRIHFYGLVLEKLLIFDIVQR